MNILQICHKPPFPPVEGGAIAMYSLYNGLVDSGNNVHVLAMNTYKQRCDINKVPESFLRQSKYTLVEMDIRIKPMSAFLNLFSNKSYNIIRFYSQDFKLKLCQILENNAYDVIILESLYTTPYIDLIRKWSNARIVLRTHNVEYNIWENLARNEEKRLKRWYLNLLSVRLKKYELVALTKVDLIAAISNEDISVFRETGCQTPMVYLPFGINFNDDEYKIYESPKVEELILFHVGSMEWLPHQEAFKWFLEKVWPAIHIRNKNAKLYLAGANMPNWILQNKYPNVIIENGYVDGKYFVLKKALMIVPSFSGSGIRIKIAQGLAKGKVIITTANGIMGIPCVNGEHVFVSDNWEEWVQIIDKCVNDLFLVRQISKNARAFSQTEFDYIASAKKLIDVLEVLPKKEGST